MGYCCFHGLEMEADAEKAVLWLTRAAKQGNANAWYYMGECYRTGTGVAKDDQKAADWYNGAAKQGHTDAARMLEILYPSRPTPSFIPMRIQPDLEAACGGNEHAQFVLGNAYYDGEFMPKDRAQAAVWFRQSAEQGYAPSQNNLGCYYYSGWEVKADDEKAAYWFGKAADYLMKAIQQGNQAARLYHYVKTLYTPPNTKAAELNTLIPLPTIVKGRPLDEVVSRLEETFSECLLRLIDERNKKDADVYNRANIDRRTFSKIRSNKDYKPSKNTVFAFAIALELSLDDTRNLLMKAGFALSRSNKMDLIKLVEQAFHAGKELPKFKSGDTVTVAYRIVEGNKERVQQFRGDVIKIAGHGDKKRFTVRKMSGNVGVERIFPMDSPFIESITVNKVGKVRRAKLYYLRALTGKKARIKEKRS